MDKAMMLLGLLLIATPLVVLTLGIGLMDDSFDTESDTKGQHDTDSDIHSHVRIRRGNRGGDNRHDKHVERSEE